MIFPGTTIPKLPVGFINCSYSNDVCSHFEKKFNDYIIEIWIAQDDPEKREAVHQYMVCIKNDDECEALEFVEFSKEDFSAEGLQDVSKRLWLEVYRLMKKYK